MTIIKLVGPSGVVIEAPIDGWRVCECDPSSDGSDWCEGCREAFEESFAQGFDELGRPLQEEP